MSKAGVSPAPMVIGLILGPVMETSFQQSMLIGNDSFGVFLESPIATVLLILALLSILQATPFFRWLRAPFKRRLKPD